MPDPDGPMIAVKVPALRPTDTPRSAATALLPRPKRLVTSISLTAAVESKSFTLKGWQRPDRLPTGRSPKPLRVNPES
ncbi:hypothetical protein GCM10020216_037910 [Nonomuraea helvata]